jgi:hypothetical protein
MLDWLRRQAAKIFSRKTDEQMARNLDRCLFELSQIRRELDENLMGRSWTVDKIVIERLHTDKVELNLGSIDVKDLSGILSIGFNYGSRVIRSEARGGAKTAQQPLGSPGKIPDADVLKNRPHLNIRFQ